MLGLLSLVSRDEVAEFVSSLSPTERVEVLKGLQAAERKQEQALQQAAIGSLAAFVRYMWSVVEPRRALVWTWHLDVVCEFIEAFYAHDDDTLRERFDAEDVTTAVCNIPPRCTKSTLFSVLGPAWRWLNEPSTQFLCITKTDKNVKRDAGLMRRVLYSQKYQALLSMLPKEKQWTLREDQNEIRYYANTLGGHRISGTTGTDFIGVGADFISVDDPHDVEEVVLGSPERVTRLMSEVSTKYEEVWRPRLNLPYGRVMIVMQRLHDVDLAGFCHERGAARLVLPMEYEPEHPLCWSDDPRQTPGELLVPNRVTDDFIRTNKANETKWAGQYQQRPNPAEGGTLKREWFANRYSEAPESLAERADEVWLTLDAAGKGNATSDRSAAHVWARIGARWYLLWAYTERVNAPELHDLMAQALYRWGGYINKRPGGVLVEDAALGASWIQHARGRVSHVIAWHPKETPGSDKSKSARAMYLQRTAQAGNIWLPSGSPAWLSPVLQDWFSFPNGVHDDNVDAASMLQVHHANHGAVQVMTKAVSNLVFY